MNYPWYSENYADSSPSVDMAPLFTSQTNLQHQDVAYDNGLYYEGFGSLLQTNSSQLPRFPFQPQPPLMTDYLIYGRGSFETLPPYAPDDPIVDMPTSAGRPVDAANLHPPSGPSPAYDTPPLHAARQHVDSPAPQIRRRQINASAYDHYFRGEDQREQRKVLDSCLQSDWLAYNRPEPLCGRYSILCQFLSLRSSIKDPMRCLFDGCKHKFDRVDRAVNHIRTHIAHKPFSCPGGCSSRKCSKHFASPANLYSHLTRRPQTCKCCGKQILPQNMQRHLLRTMPPERHS